MKIKNLIGITFMAVLFIGFNTAHAYKITARNEYEGIVRVHAEFEGGKAICPDQEIEIQEREEGEIKSGGCCTTVVVVEALTGAAQGDVQYFYPPSTGAAIACQPYTFTIRKTADDLLVIEQYQK